jgi:hypothetical protein
MPDLARLYYAWKIKVQGVSARQLMGEALYEEDWEEVKRIDRHTDEDLSQVAEASLAAAAQAGDYQRAAKIKQTMDVELEKGYVILE